MTEIPGVPLIMNDPPVVSEFPEGSPAAERDELADLQIEAVALHYASARIADRQRTVKAQLAERMRPGDTVRPSLPGDQAPIDAGTISYTRGTLGIAGFTSDEFIAWVDENYPREVDTVVTVRPAFTKRFVVANGVIVGPTGEMDIPGLAVQQGASSLSVRVAKGADDALRSAISGGTVSAILP